MADYTTHVAFSKLVSKKIKIKDENRFLVSSLIPDLCRREDEDKIISHFASRVDGLKDPNLDLFLHKYKDKIKDEAVLGIYSHLYLDKHFFGKFFHWFALLRHPLRIIIPIFACLIIRTRENTETLFISAAFLQHIQRRRCAKRLYTRFS